MPLTKARLAKEAVRAAAEFHRQAIWDWLTDEEVFALRLPGRESPVAVAVLGASGIEFGLALYVGADALGDVRRLVAAGPGLDEDRLDGADEIMLVFRPLGDFPPESRRLLDLGGFSGRAESPAPGFHRKAPGRPLRDPNRDELEMLLYAIRAILAADEAGELWPGPLDVGEDVLTLTVTGDPRRPEVAVSLERLHPRRDLPELSPPAVPEGLGDLPRIDAVWHVAFALAPSRVEDEDETPRLLFVGEEWPVEGEGEEGFGEEGEDEFTGEDGEPDGDEDDYDWDDEEDDGDEEEEDDGDTGEDWDDDPIHAIEAEFLPGRDLEAAAVRVLDVLATGGRSGEPCLPRGVVFSNRALFDRLAPALATIEVSSRYEPWQGSYRLLVDDEFEEIGIFRPGLEWDESEGYSGPRLVNMDGHPIAFHVATLSVEDEEEVRKAFAARGDLEPAGKGAWTWVGPPRENRSLETVHKGRIQLLPGEIRLETNSEERCDEACDWLEEIPGVVFETVEELDYEEELAKQFPPGARRPYEGKVEEDVDEERDIELSDEGVDALNEMLRRHYMNWIDDPMPMFGGRTPREMCETEAGRRRVRHEIDAIPTPTSSPGVKLHVPKEEMLRALGLA